MLLLCFFFKTGYLDMNSNLIGPSILYSRGSDLIGKYNLRFLLIIKISFSSPFITGFKSLPGSNDGKKIRINIYFL